MSFPSYDRRPAGVPEAWGDLIEGLWLIAAKGADKSHLNDISPIYCSHDVLTVCADPSAFTAAELEKLEKLGFDADTSNGCFTSWKFGSA